ncbi:hypothetical protein FRB96_004818 [Tulasnella sp. 330]|nr:hypothetical protein FRB96_004818 [Tulasnella sp. 330]
MARFTQILCTTYQELTLLPRVPLTPEASALGGWPMFVKAVARNWDPQQGVFQYCTFTEPLSTQRHGNAPSDESATAPLRDTIFSTLLKEWNRSRRRDFYLKMVQGGARHLPEAVSTADLQWHLSLATSFLVCGAGCNDIVSPIRTFDETFGQHFCKSSTRSYWDFDTLIFDKDASLAVAKCIEAAGLDPSITTWKEMDNLNYRFCCIDCPHGAFARSWRNCALHPRAHRAFAFQGWELLSSERAFKVIASEAVKDLPRRFIVIDGPDNYWHELMTQSEIITHIGWKYRRDATRDDMRWDQRIPPPAIPLKGTVVSEQDIPREFRARKPPDPHRKECPYCSGGLFNARGLREHIDEW